MAKLRRGPYERIVIGPLSVLSLIAAVLHLVASKWILSILFVLVWVLLGVIGQSLHPRRSTGELAGFGPPPGDAEQEPLPSLAQENSASGYLGMLSVPVAAVLALYHGAPWYWCIPIGLGLGALVAGLGGLMIGFFHEPD